MLLRVVGGLLLAVLLAFAGWHIYLATQIGGITAAHAPLVDFSRLELTPKPNQHLVLPDGFAAAAKPHAIAPRFAASPDQLRDAVLALVASEPATEIVARSEDGLRLTVLQRTRLMRYPDFISLEILPAEGGSTLAVYSRSVFGYSDLGVNAKRVTAWLAALGSAVPPAP